MGCCCCKNETPVVHPVVKKERIPSIQKTVNVGQINDVGISTSDPSLLISGYEKEPLVSLEESLEPFDGRIQHLDGQIKQAKSHCHYPSEHHLTDDESAAIYLYSMRGDTNSVHEHLQRAWNTGDRSQMRPWFRYLRLLRSGLNKLPNTRGEVWQGTAYDPNLAHTLQSDSLPLYTSMGSSSTSLTDLKHDLNAKSGPRMILVGYKSIDGKDVTGYTESNSKEVFLWPGMKLNRGKNGETDGYGALTMHLIGRPSKCTICFGDRSGTVIRFLFRYADV